MTALINHTIPTSNYTVISNELIASTIPAKAQKVLLYLLSKPKDWQLHINDIRKRLGLSNYSARQALQWLTRAGYLFYKRLKTGHTIWHVYSEPKPAEPPVLKPQIEIPNLDFQHVLVNTENFTKYDNTLQPDPLPSVPSEIVVVSSKVKAQLSKSMKPNQVTTACKLLSQLTQAQIQAVVLVYTAMAAKGQILNKIGYLIKLINLAKNDALDTPENPYAGKITQPLENRITETKKRLESAQNAKIDNKTWFEKMRQQYGDKFKA